MKSLLLILSLFMLASCFAVLAVAEETKPIADTAKAKVPIADTQKAEAEASPAPVVQPAPAVQPAPVMPSPVTNPATLLLNESDKLWRTRHKSGNDQKSILKAELALEKGAGEFDVLWRVARGCFWVAENSADKKTKITLGEKGWKAGEKAAELKPDRVEGWYWGVVSLGQYSKGIGVAKAFFMGIAGTFEKMNEKAIKIDKKYGFAGPERSFGRYWSQVPWPKRNLKRSQMMLQSSAKMYPKKLRTYFYIADTYLALKEKEKAKKALETCLALSPKNEEYPDGIIYIKECQKLFDKEFK